jgi:hypothetical protein
VKVCFSCRGEIPPLEEIRPSFALRDGAVIHRKLILQLSLISGAQSMMNDAKKLQMDKPIVKPPLAREQLASEDAFVFDPRQHGASSSSLLEDLMRHEEEVRRRQLEEDEAFAKMLAAEFERSSQEARVVHAIPQPTSSQSASSSAQAQKSASSILDSLSSFLSSARSVPSSSASSSSKPNSSQSVGLFRNQNAQQKTCGHVCSFSTMQSCCACMDRRPKLPEGTYPVYMDGKGWINKGMRAQHYCPVCKTSL